MGAGKLTTSRNGGEMPPFCQHIMGSFEKEVGVRKASEPFLDFNGRKSLKWDRDAVSELTINKAPEGHAEIANGASPSRVDQSLVHFRHHRIPRGNTELPSDIIFKIFLWLFYLQMNLGLKSSNLTSSQHQYYKTRVPPKVP